ncbi:hypothetical protein SAMN06265365_10791 [Tistlia consotensis]|uniref:Uncharacterized protein n=1 Tax=Tistlia consotensis USBA 355 TaxID=560819 RepID=A0A1Y6B7Y6_9PROT|nr:hypothetical protein [Tistlia consotensis]SME97633.1 hypothetical protein SAMN05428998_10293 [Tistlia consotensis USBA 355]SNR56990.1 hypothetical protein SAMN06265365_10791 [Tistlia consotensis]
MTAKLLHRALAGLRRLPAPLRLAAAALALLLLYLPVADLMELHEEARLARLSQAAPARFLALERSRHGMAAYLDALARLRHFDRWRETAPDFLIGAWALPEPSAEDEETGGDPGSHCLSGLVIEDGRVRWFGRRHDRAGAHYRIEHGAVLVRLADGGLLRISVPAQPAGDQRIEVLLPGRTAPQPAWRCL